MDTEWNAMGRRSLPHPSHVMIHDIAWTNQSQAASSIEPEVVFCADLDEDPGSVIHDNSVMCLTNGSRAIEKNNTLEQKVQTCNQCIASHDNNKLVKHWCIEIPGPVVIW